MLTPLAEQFRPTSLDDIVGQDHLLAHEGVIRTSIASKKPLSFILFGPPGCGKTSLARLYAKEFSLNFRPLSAIFSGVGDLKKIVKEAQETDFFNKGTLVFVDEIHRFNVAQQEAFLPFVEDGTLILIGATAENPAYHLSKALLSRLRILVLKPLEHNHLESLLQRYEEKEKPLHLDPSGRETLIQSAHGDGRYLFNLIESLRSIHSEKALDAETVNSVLQKRGALYDKQGDFHHNLISSLHKSVRGSDPDAALYWFCRMLEGGEDPRYLARRLIRMASEDVGLADPQALPQAIAARDAYEQLGSPEGELALAQLVLYLALAPKSNAAYLAYGEACKSAKETSHISPPKHILNSFTKTTKEMGYGVGYAYDHDCPNAFSGQNYFPEEIGRQEFYRPVERGFEREMQKRKHYFNKLRTARTKESEEELS